MYICNNCGAELEYSDIRVQKDYYNEGDGERWFCPHCISENIEEAKSCEICGKNIPQSHFGNICDACIEEECTVDNAIEFGRNEKTDVKVNEFVAHMLTEEEINELLELIVKYKFSKDKKAVIDYVDANKDIFAEFVFYKEKNRQWQG